MPIKKVLVDGERGGGIKIAKQIRFSQRKVVFKTKKVLNMKYCQSSFKKRFESVSSGKKNKPVFRYFKTRITIKVNVHKILHVKVL